MVSPIPLNCHWPAKSVHPKRLYHKALLAMASNQRLEPLLYGFVMCKPCSRSGAL
jgi:hypothetical protein